MVGINLDGFSLANRLRFAKFAKLSPRQTFPLYGNYVIEINKNLKFKKGVGIAIKSKETSSKLAI